MKIRNSSALLAAALVSTALWAEPAAWFKWRSLVNDHEICAQTSPGEGWVRSRGPFQDGGCRKPGTPR